MRRLVYCNAATDFKLNVSSFIFNKQFLTDPRWKSVGRRKNITMKKLYNNIN